MKRGKEIKMDDHTDYNSLYGTVDNKSPKSIYIDVSTWGTPKSDNEDINYDKVIKDINKRIKSTITKNLNTDYFSNNFIVDLDMRESGIRYKKKSYLNCNVTLYQTKELGIMDNKLEELMKDITSKIIEELDNDKYFKFYKSKK